MVPCGGGTVSSGPSTCSPPRVRGPRFASPADVSLSAVELAPPAPAKRGWLIPVILGGAFLMLVILAIVFIPILVKSFLRRIHR